MSRYATINFDKKLSDEDRQYLLDRSRQDLVEENGRKFPKKGKEAEEDYQPPYTVAPPAFDANVEVDGQAAADFHVPTVMPPRPGDRVDGSAEVKGAHPLVQAEQEANVDDLNVEELKDELRARDLPVSGDKKELQKRLSEAVESE